MTGDADTIGGRFPSELEGSGGRKGVPEDVTQNVASAATDFNGNPDTNRLLLDLRGVNGGIYSGNINTTTPLVSGTHSSTTTGSNTALTTNAAAISNSHTYPRCIFKSAAATFGSPTTTTTLNINFSGIDSRTYMGTGFWFQSYSGAGVTYNASFITDPNTSISVELDTNDSFFVSMWNTAPIWPARRGTFYDGTAYQTTAYQPAGLANWTDDLGVSVLTTGGAAPTADFGNFSMRASSFYSGWDFLSMNASVTGDNFD